jgi:hypothetical protein
VLDRSFAARAAGSAAHAAQKEVQFGKVDDKAQVGETNNEHIG